MLQDHAGGGGGCACDRDGVGFGGEGESVGSADAVSAAGGEEWGQTEECEACDPNCFAAMARANREECGWGEEECQVDG